VVLADINEIKAYNIPEEINFNLYIPTNTDFTDYYTNSISIYKINEQLITPHIYSLNISPIQEDGIKIFKVTFPTILFIDYINANSLAIYLSIKDKENNLYTGKVNFKIIHTTQKCIINKNLFTDATEPLIIKIKKEQDIKAAILLFNNKKELIFTLKNYYSIEMNYYLYKLNLKELNLPNGIYFLFIDTNKFKKIYKILIRL